MWRKSIDGKQRDPKCWSVTIWECSDGFTFSHLPTPWKYVARITCCREYKWLMDPAATPQDLLPSHQGHALLGCSQPMTEHADLPRQACFSKMWDASSCQPWLEVSPLVWPNLYLNCAGVKILPTQVFFFLPSFLPRGITHASESKDSSYALLLPTPVNLSDIWCHFVICSLVDPMDTALSKPWEMVKDRETWHAVGHGVTKSWTRFGDWTAIKAQMSAAFLVREFLPTPLWVRFSPRFMKTPKMVFMEITQKEVGVDSSFYCSPLTPSPHL